MTEESLGKRIAAWRKGLGLTQDALAEKLGVTAQAVSKWENDQSCPDIAMLPKLAEIFDITIDALLGVERKEEVNPQKVPSVQTQQTVPVTVLPGKRLSIGIALWLLLAGAVMLIIELRPVYYLAVSVSLWKVICLTGLVVFGLFGLYPKFSIFRLGCAVFGGYYLCVNLFQPVVTVHLNEELLLPILLLFFGLGLLVDSIRGKKIPGGHFAVDGAGKNVFECKGNAFVCSTFFGDDHRNICLPILEGGEGNVLFGNLSIDLHDCCGVSEDAAIRLKSCFGQLTLYVPRQWRLQCINRTAFGNIREYGAADESAQQVLRVENDVVFGEINIRYI